MIMSEYLCVSCGRFESLESQPVPDFTPCPECGELAEWVISAPHAKVWSVPCTAVVRGGDMTDRPKGMLDTRPLADGKMTHREWKAHQAEKRRERRHDLLVKKGIKQKRVQV